MKWKIGKFTRKSVLVLCSFVLLVLSTQAEDSKTKNRPFILIHSENIARDFTKTDLRWEWSCLGCSGTGSECKCGYSEDKLGNLAPQIVFFKILFIYFRQRGMGEERQGNINVWLPLACSLLGTWPGPQPRHVPWVGIKLATLWFEGRYSIHWATPARALQILFWSLKYPDGLY